MISHTGSSTGPGATTVPGDHLLAHSGAAPPAGDDDPPPEWWDWSDLATEFDVRPGTTLEGDLGWTPMTIEAFLGKKETFESANGGKVTTNANGTFTYTPKPGFLGEDSFIFTVETDDGTYFIPVTIVVSKLPIAPPPRPVDPPSATPAGGMESGDDQLPLLGAARAAGDDDPPPEDPENPLGLDTFFDTSLDEPLEGYLGGRDGDEFFPDTVKSGEGGTVTIRADGTFTYTPRAGFSGTDCFVFTVDTEDGIIDVPVFVSVSDLPLAPPPRPVEPPAPPPPAVPPPGGEPSVATALVAAAEGARDLAAVAAPGAAGDVPPQPVAGQLVVTAIAAAANLVRAVPDGPDLLPANRPPVAVDDSYTTRPGRVVSGNVLTNDHDPDGDAISLVGGARVFKTINDGVVELFDDGGFRYAHAPSFTGLDFFFYEITDGRANSSDMVFIDVINKAPVAWADHIRVRPFEVGRHNLLANDSDPDGDAIWLDGGAKLFRTARDGVVEIDEEGNLAYAHAPDVLDRDWFAYTITDGWATSTTNVFIKIINEAPVAVADSFRISHDRKLTGNVLVNDYDPDGDELAVELDAFDTEFEGKVVIWDDGEFTYTPRVGFVGRDSFDYVVDDGLLADTGTVTIDVVNAAPVAADDSFTMARGQTLRGNLLANDRDPDGDALHMLVRGEFVNGRLNLAADGSFTYTPRAGFTGRYTYEYQVFDSLDEWSTATLTIDIKNRPPVAVADAFTTRPGTPVRGNVMANDSDPDGDALSAEAVTLTTAGQGEVVLDATGSFEYRPKLGFKGEDSFTYTLKDSLGDTAVGTVSIAVRNKDPVAVADKLQMHPGKEIRSNVLTNDWDWDDDAIFVSPGTRRTANGIEVNVATDGSFTYTSPYKLDDSFSYTLFDGYGGSSTGQVVIEATNRNPLVASDQLTVRQNGWVSANILANDVDPDGDPLHLAGGTYRTNAGGLVVEQRDGTILYGAPTDFQGRDSFNYLAFDDYGGLAIGHVGIDVMIA